LMGEACGGAAGGGRRVKVGVVGTGYVGLGLGAEPGLDDLADRNRLTPLGDRLEEFFCTSRRRGAGRQPG
jgi:hypothetical protein